MNNYIFTFFIIALSLILILMVTLVIREIVESKRRGDRYRPPIKYLRSYKDGYAFSDNQDLSHAVQVIYITSEYIDYSETGINGKFDRVWSK